MKPNLSVAVCSGSHEGSIEWDPDRSSFRARFDLFAGASIANPQKASKDERGVVSPYEFELGRAVAEFVTFDRLCNQLAFEGLPLASASRHAGEALRTEVSARFGEVEVVGLDGQHLFLALPGEVLLPLRPEIDAKGHRFGWGACGPASIRSARAIVRHAWSANFGVAEEVAARALAATYLGGCGPNFSLNANSVCDWLLFDIEPFTKYDHQDYQVMRKKCASGSQSFVLGAR